MEQTPNWREMILFLLEHNDQSEVVKITGIAQPTISKVKNGGGYDKPTWETGNALIKAYNKELDNAKFRNNYEPM